MQVWGVCHGGGAPWMGLLPCAALLGHTPTPRPSSSYLAGHPSEIPEAEHMGTWSEGEQVLPCSPSPERAGFGRLTQGKRAGCKHTGWSCWGAQHPMSLEPHSIRKFSRTDRTFISWPPLLMTSTGHMDPLVGFQ